MPVTPFHLGPAYLVKSLKPKYFSFRVFLLTQFIIDLEPLYFMLKDEYPLHRMLHTYLGAVLVSLVCIWPGRSVCLFFSRLWNRIFKEWPIDLNISTSSAVVAAFFGGISHVILDSIMHPDIKPFWPFTDANGLLHAITLSQLHLFCLGTGLAGYVFYLLGKKSFGMKNNID